MLKLFPLIQREPHAYLQLRLQDLRTQLRSLARILCGATDALPGVRGRTSESVWTAWREL